MRAGVDYSDTIGIYYFNKSWTGLLKEQKHFIATNWRSQINKFIDKHSRSITTKSIEEFMGLYKLRLLLIKPPEYLK